LAKIRTIVLTNFPLCTLCSNKSQAVHHISYKTNVLLGNDLSKLFALCNSCHQILEFSNNKYKKLTFEAVNYKSYRLLEIRILRGEIPQIIQKCIVCGQKATKRMV
jgi:hypothetical protein